MFVKSFLTINIKYFILYIISNYLFMNTKARIRKDNDKAVILTPENIVVYMLNSYSKRTVAYVCFCPNYLVLSYNPRMLVYL